MTDTLAPSWGSQLNSAALTIRRQAGTIATLTTERDDARAALEWIAGMAEVRAADDKQVFTRVNRGALRNIAARARSIFSKDAQS